jgi:hypothetical protein
VRFASATAVRGAAAELLHAIGCTNDRCLAVGPLARSETEADQKWNTRNLNITLRIKK